MASKKKFSDTLKPLSGESKKKFEALLNKKKKSVKKDKYSELMKSDIYKNDEDLKL